MICVYDSDISVSESSGPYNNKKNEIMTKNYYYKNISNNHMNHLWKKDLFLKFNSMKIKDDL